MWMYEHALDVITGPGLVVFVNVITWIKYSLNNNQLNNHPIYNENRVRVNPICTNISTVIIIRLIIWIFVFNIQDN